MFYEELYAELGKLFYYVADADGEIQESEKAALNQFIDEKWKPLDDSVDDFGTDKGNMISFSFDYAESQSESNNLNSFELFYKLNRDKFTKDLKQNILATSEAIASSFRGTNQKEKKALDQIREILKD